MKLSTVDLHLHSSWAIKSFPVVFDIGDAARKMYKKLFISFEISLREVSENKIYEVTDIFIVLNTMLSKYLYIYFAVPLSRGS